MRNIVCVGIIVVGVLAVGTLLAKKGEIVLKDGRTLSGEITQIASGDYELATAGRGGVTRIAKDEVKSVEYYDNIEQVYAKKKALLAKDDVKGYYDLAAWAEKNDLMEQMADAARTVLALQPDHLGAKLMMSSYDRWKANPTKPPVGPVTPPVGPTIPAGKPGTSQPDTVLSDRDVNIIRLVEMQPREPVRLEFKKGALEEFWTTMKAANNPDFQGDANKNRFFSMSPTGQLDVMINATDADRIFKLTDVVTIKSDPAAMLTWRTTIHPWLLNSCANASCHGSPTSPGPRYINYGVVPPNTNSIYTNFYVVSEYRTKNGEALIDRGKPADSLLLQFALPPDLAGRQHAKVKDNPIPVFLPRGKTGLYNTIFNWIADRRAPGIRNEMERLPYHIAYPLTSGATTPPKVGPGPGPTPGPGPAPGPGPKPPGAGVTPGAGPPPAAGPPPLLPLPPGK